MPRKLALKKLKASDLSFFQTYLARNPQSKQKAFNLDQKVVEGQFFPSLTAEIDAMPDKRAGVALTFFGPGGAAPHPLMRKVLRQQKNWRLNGEAVYNPDDLPKRYDSLAPEDIAIMEFTGTSVPNAIKVVLLAAASPEDAVTRSAFASAYPGESMSVLSEEAIEQVIAKAGTPADHPIRDWLDKNLLEEVGQGDAEATERLQGKRKARGITSAELNRAKASAEAVGQLGEEILDFHFSTASLLKVSSHEWVASVNAISPFDFLLHLSDGGVRHADAKSTSGPFNNPIHMSLAEVHHALTSGVPYDIYRLYDVRQDGATLRVALDIAQKLAPVAANLKSLPAGVKANSLSFSPDYFDFASKETTVEYGDAE